jgi:hypothetical protein
VKTAVRERDGFRCTKCGVPNETYRRLCGRQLEVHRKVPGSAYTLDGCVTLCQPCHGPEPRRKPRQKQEEEPHSPTAVHIPAAWVGVLRKLAGARAVPPHWYVILKLLEAAKEAGITDLPPTPWQTPARKV